MNTVRVAPVGLVCELEQISQDLKKQNTFSLKKTEFIHFFCEVFETFFFRVLEKTVGGFGSFLIKCLNFP